MIKAVSPVAIDLMRRGTIALSRIESNGILVDEVYLDRAIRRTQKKVKRIRNELIRDPVYKVWRKRFGARTKLGAPEQLAKVVFEDYKYEPIKGHTKTKKYKANEEAFEHVDLPFVKTLFEMKRLQKALSTNLKGLKREIIDGYVHAIYNLNVAITFRSTCTDPNVQNQPVRNEDIGALIRRCFIAPKRYRIGEIDYSKIEVCIAACYTKDPTLIKDVEDSNADMHRDTAKQLFKLGTTDAKLKPIRQTAKNGFVFPEFYGSYYVDCAKNIWDDIVRYNLQTTKGVPLREHLKRKGITERGLCDKDKEYDLEPFTFEYLVKQVEEDFWKRRFKVYSQWKIDWWQKFLRRAWFKMKTGFICQGLLNRKQVCNSPIQGSAFHCLLWSLIELEEWLRKSKCKTKIIGEIHDSMLLQFHVREVEDVLHKANEIMTQNIREAWPWIIVPLAIEAEIAPEGGSWAQKEKVSIAA